MKFQKNKTNWFNFLQSPSKIAHPKNIYKPWNKSTTNKVDLEFGHIPTLKSEVLSLISVVKFTRFLVLIQF